MNKMTHQSARKVLLTILMFAAFSAVASAQMNIFKVEAEADAVVGYDIPSNASGIAVNGFVKVTTELKPSSSESSIGDPFAGPYVEFQLKDALVGGYGGWGESSSAGLSNSVAFDYAKIAYKEFYLKLYNNSAGTYELFGHESKSSFWSVQRKAAKRFGGAGDADNLKNSSYYSDNNMGYYPAVTFDDVLSLGYTNGTFGDVELVVASANSWLDHSEWGVGVYEDNRNAYAFSLNVDMKAVPRLELSSRFLFSLGYKLYDESTVVPQKLFWGLQAGYEFPLPTGMAIVPKLGFDTSLDRPTIESKSGFHNAFGLSTGAAVVLKWPGIYDEDGENLFFGKQTVYSGVTLASNFTPSFPDLDDGINDTSDLNLSLSVWNGTDDTGITSLPLGFGLAYEISDLLSEDPKMDLMAAVEYKLDNGLIFNLGSNFAFKNRENEKMDMGNAYAESNKLDATLTAKWVDLIPSMDVNFKYQTGDLLPEDSRIDWGTVAAGVTVKFN